MARTGWSSPATAAPPPSLCGSATSRPAPRSPSAGASEPRLSAPGSCLTANAPAAGRNCPAPIRPTTRCKPKPTARYPSSPSNTYRNRIPAGTSASRTRFPQHVFQEPGVGEVAEERNTTFPDPQDLDGRGGQRPARRGDRRLRPHLRDHHLRVLALVKLRHLVVLQPQR